MNTLIDNLLLFDRLNEQQIRLISRITRQVHLRAGEYYTEPGNTLSQLAFVEKGVLRYNYYNSKAENITSSLIGDGNFVAAASHLQVPVITSEYLQAVTECTLSVIGKSSMEELSATVSNWDRMVSSISQRAISERRNRTIRPFKKMNAELMAEQYLKRVLNIGNYLNVHQLLQYINAPVSARNEK